MNTASEPETESLDLQDCWRCLRSASICRIAFTDGGTVEILPVNYVPTNGILLMRTGEGTKLGSAAERGLVAVEADGMNQYGTIAWSVVVKGQAEIVTDPEDIQDAVNAGLSPWQAGPKDILLRVTPAELSGRRFVIAPPTRWWPPQEPVANGAP